MNTAVDLIGLLAIGTGAGALFCCFLAALKTAVPMVPGRDYEIRDSGSQCFVDGCLFHPKRKV